MAHGDAGPEAAESGTLVAVYATAVSSFLLHWGRELGFRSVLLEPDPDRLAGAHRREAGEVVDDPGAVALDADTDVVVTDHHRDDLGAVMAPLVAGRPRWIGIMGSARHTGPHIEALRAAGIEDGLIATVRRPIGLDIGSKTPPEIALATLAGLLADRNGRPGTPMSTAPSGAGVG